MFRSRSFRVFIDRFWRVVVLMAKHEALTVKLISDEKIEKLCQCMDKFSTSVITVQKS
jgi:hypothetical protein